MLSTFPVAYGWGMDVRDGSCLDGLVVWRAHFGRGVLYYSDLFSGRAVFADLKRLATHGKRSLRPTDQECDMGQLLHAEFGLVDVVDDISHDLLNITSRSHRIARSRSQLDEIDDAMVELAAKAFPWVTRGALSVVFFWFGFIKLVGLSEATGLAKALTAKTVGLDHFGVLFAALAVLECVIGVLCLVPSAIRVLLPLVFVHLMLVCAPLVLVPELTWQSVLVPTMDGQYIIKNVLIIAAVIGLAAHPSPRPRST